MARPGTKRTSKAPEPASLEKLVNQLEQLTASPSGPFPRGIGEISFEYESKGERVKLHLRGMPERAPEANLLTRALIRPVEGTDEYKLQWSIPGHAVIAMLAEDLLNDLYPAASQRLTALIATDPRDGRDELAKYATWPDEMKKDPAFKKKTETWHYITLPFTPGDDQRKPLPGGTHVLSALKEQLRLLAQSTNPEERADALAFVTHLVGDIHQPLHCVSLVNDQFPEGDRGGNSFKLAHGKNMHSLWDGLVASKPAEIPRNAETLRLRFPKERFAEQLQAKDFEQWIWESHELGREAYERILAEPAGQRASQTYRNWARAKAQERSALAAYRLAELLASTLR